MAVELREALRRSDDESRRVHGMRWATAFPTDDPASAHRYVNQFLGVPRKGGLPEGGAAFLGFVRFDGVSQAAHVSLTKSGAEWAGFENPVFDHEEGADSTFSVEEAKFFLDHLRRYRSGEYQFSRRSGELSGHRPLAH
ncbi:MAG: hypothetical protein K6T28_00180 [Acidothermus sp.]|nr:hypothetical protein [Acidothermus sp.]